MTAMPLIPGQIAQQENEAGLLLGFPFNLRFEFRRGEEIGQREPLVALLLVHRDPARQNLTRKLQQVGMGADRRKAAAKQLGQAQPDGEEPIRPYVSALITSSALPTPGVRFALDSPLEGTGFEPSVPPDR